MPRGKAIKFPSPEDVGRELAKRERALAKQFEDRIKKLTVEIGPKLLHWTDEEKTKDIPSSTFECEEEQNAIALALTHAKWKVDNEGAGLVVHRPAAATLRKPGKKGPTVRKAAAEPAKPTIRRAGRDPAPVVGEA